MNLGAARRSRFSIDLVVVLDEVDEGGGRQVPAGFAANLAAAVARGIALVDVAGGECGGELVDRPLVILVIAVQLTGQQHVDHVVVVVVPLGGVGVGIAAGLVGEEARLVGVVLQHQVHLAV